MIARAPDAPSYDSPEWLALPDDSPAKWAALARAAECWARDGEELEERLRREVLALSRANKRAEDADYVAQVQHGYDHRQPSATELEAEFWDWIRGAA